MKKHLIITSSDRKYGDFLIVHWLRSLQDNVNLKEIDIVVISYGLSESQTELLTQCGVTVVAGSTGGHIVTKRFSDIGKFLSKNSYDQVMCVDGGDIIFQKDISSLFEHHKDSFRIVKIDMETLYFEYFIYRNFDDLSSQRIRSVLNNKNVLNAGVILSSYTQCIRLCQDVVELVGNNKTYGPDQIAVNYNIYKDKHYLLDNIYNFMPTLAREKMSICDGTCYREDGEKIAIVHNSGRNGFFRSIKNFGYGATYNQPDYKTYIAIRIYYRILQFLRSFIHLYKNV